VAVLASVLRGQVAHRRGMHPESFMASGVAEYPGAADVGALLVGDVDGLSVLAGAGGGERVSHMARLPTGVDQYRRQLRPRMRDHSFRVSLTTSSSS